MILVGTGGEGNLTQHEGKSECRQNVKRKESEKKSGKPRTLFDVGLLKQSNKSNGTRSNPTHGRLLSPPLILASASYSPRTVSSSQLEPQGVSIGGVSGCPDALKLINELRLASVRLPGSVPVGTPGDLIANFSTDSAILVDPNIADVWETVDPMLNQLVGWGKTDEDISMMLRRGEKGLAGLIDFLEYFVVQRGVKGALLEGKVQRIIRAVDILAGPITRPTNEKAVTRWDSTQQALSPTVSTNVAAHRNAVYPNVKEVIDVDGIDDDVDPQDDAAALANEAARKQPTKSHRCTGLHIPIPPGNTAYGGYPFKLHDTHTLPWDVHLVGRKLILQVEGCTGITSGGSCCHSCASLTESRILCAIRDRMENGIHENSPHAFQPIDGLLKIIKRKTESIDTMRVTKMNAGRKLAGKLAVLADTKKFIIAGAQHGGVRLDALMRVCLKNQMGVRGMTRMLHKMVDGVYSPKGYTEEELARGILLLKLGGARVAEISHRSMGGPGVSTLRRHVVIKPLRASSSTPTIADIVHNIEASFDESDLTDKETPTNMTGYVLMLDEIKVEARPRWDDSTNTFLGICREHGHMVGLNFCSIEEIEALYQAIEAGDVHLATEATVAAVGLLSDNTRVYASRPILVSGTCKRESAEPHASLIRNIIEACESQSDKVPGRLLCIASDGEARRGAALAMPSFDELVDKDYKHIFKRLRNLLLRDKGTNINGVHITTSLLSVHLRADNMPPHRANYLLNPDDKQDVTLVFMLLKAIWELRDPLPTDKPAFANARRHIKILGDLFYHLLAPYILVTLSLHEQLVHLSAAAHLLLFLYSAASTGTRFMPKILYDDIQIMIKNVYFCVAKVKIDHPHAKFWIILLGTDRLEVSFGIYRTMVGNDANTDILQLSSRISNVTETARILAKYPHWDRGPRRLKLPALEDTTSDLSSKVDHINPSSWKGDVRVSSVLPITAWNEGSKLIEERWIDLDIQAALDRLSEQPEVDMLFPHGRNRGSANRTEEDAEEDEPEDDDDGDARESQIEPEIRPLTDDLASEMDLEDHLAIEEAQANPNAFCPFIEIEGKPVYKAKILREYFKYKTRAGSTDRLKRVAGLLRFAVTSMPTTGTTIESDSVFGASCLFVNEPATTLVTSDNRIFLAIVQVTTISLDSRPVDFISSEILPEKTVSISFQILNFAEVDQTGLATEFDWQWDQSLGSSHKSPGRFIQAVNPAVSTPTSGPTSYLFRTTELQSLAATLYSYIQPEDRTLLPSVKATEKFPYRSSGRAAFVCEDEGAERTLGDTGLDECPRCHPPYEWDRTLGQRIIEHIGTHILFDTGIDHSAKLCGFCIRPQTSSGCMFYLRKGKGSSASHQVDLQRSRCPNLIKFAYLSASVSSASAPCTNVPVRCPLCASADPAVWRYNMRSHFKLNHSTVSWANYDEEYSISSSERAAMLLLWQKRHAPKKKSATKWSSNLLVISDAHSSRLATSRSESETQANSLTFGDNEEPIPSESGCERETEHCAANNDDQLEVQVEYTAPPASSMPATHVRTHGQQARNAKAGPSSTSLEFLASNQTNFNVAAHPTHIGRVRKTRDMGEVSACVCGAQVTEQEKEAEQVAECTERGCETRWYHLDCLNFIYVPHNWKCDAHGRPTKRIRRR
ncbi:hypothetical protein BJ138DRAFT_1104514 [Hygrophoropsis aurantiaca]|uniref:Uncharacterized protein n=1 Tax=Hygrophoropsis aurantiaca TaxID=72124 RepID=A0ACB8A3A0_9AGAM|nr:hypothetical protein BJ138DRAFT_1104514 [Hygrophoropsis aurantiaca]